MSKTLRINKYLAQLGIASRRKADELLAQGRVSINGEVIKQHGVQVDIDQDEVEVDGVVVGKPNRKKHYYALYKPKNVVTTISDPEKRPCVGDLIKTFDTHVFPVGRLDFDAEGLLLLTNDGEASNRMLHPTYHVEKTYRVKVKGVPSKETMAKLAKGIKLDDGFIKPSFVKLEKILKENSWITMTITEGRKHLVKRIWLRLDHPVIRLVRTEFGPIKLLDLKPGEVRKLTPKEIQKIQSIGA
ncbi:MAG: rRNA pseudouridine synthase [Bdellovibrionales bacterium]|nr:rRNA pseudouridine synthase [Bdellovibrionales bacterium]